MSKLTVEIGMFRPPLESLKPLTVSVTALALLAPAWQQPALPLATSLALLLAALAAGRLSVWLAGQPLPLNLLAVVLVPSWVLLGAWPTAGLAVLAAVFNVVTRGESRLPLQWQIPANLAAVAIGTNLGNAVYQWLPREVGGEIPAACAFALGYGLGQIAVEWFSLYRASAGLSWPVLLLTNLVLTPPGLFLAQIARHDELLPFAGTLALVIILLLLIRTLTNSETRSAELQAEAARTANAREYLELVVDYSPEAMFGMDAEGRVRWLNRTAAEWLGVDARALIGRPAQLAIPIHQPSGALLDHAALAERAVRESRPVHQEGRLDGAAGAPRHVLVSYSAIADRGRARENLRLVLLRDAREVTESLREQEELAVHLSHELKAPLTTILGYAQLMSRSGDTTLRPDAQREFARRISESGDYMLRLINNLLDLGRLGRELPLDKQPTELVALTREVVAGHQVQASAKAQELRFVEPPEPVVLETVDLLVRQALTNLISNAIKYTPPNGHVTVTLTSTPDEVVWQVIDDGIGLTEEEQAKLFTRFFRSQRPEARLIKGTGLGLALTKSLVEHLGGTIEVQSVVDRGSTFTIRLRRATSSSPSSVSGV